jgi:hypothetical protein
MSFDDLPTLGELQARPRASQKGKTRLEEAMDARTLTRVDAKAFRAAVIARDGYRCRCCGRKVIKTVALVPERLEVHHIHGRVGDLAFEDKAALVSCASCHQKLTGKVNAHRVIIIPTQTFEWQGKVLCDARFAVVFREMS